MPGPYSANSTADELVVDYANIIKDKVILTTGVTPGTLGGYFVQAVAKANPAWLILAARNPEKLSGISSEITSANPDVKVRTLQVDLSSFQSVRDAAATVNSWDDIPAIDVLVNNAGIMAVDYKLTDDGIESQFATNHLGPFLFTNLIIKKLAAAKEPRVVNVSSDGHRMSSVRFHDYNFDGGNTYNRWAAYGQSKTANMLFSLSLVQKLGVKYNLQAYSLHPGVIIETNLTSHLNLQSALADMKQTDRAMGNKKGWVSEPLKTLAQGTSTHVYAAFDPNLKPHNGAYLVNTRVADPYEDTVRPHATSLVEAEKLWRLSEKLVGQEFPY